MRVSSTIIFLMAFCLTATGHAGDEGFVPEAGVEASLLIDAPVAEVWKAALDVPTWPEWIDFIYYSSMNDEKLRMGTTFRIVLAVKGAPFPFKLTVCEYDEHKRVTWYTGSEHGVKVHRSLIFEDQDGKTLVKSVEQFQGPMTKYMLQAISEEDFTAIHEEWLEAINQRVTSRD